MNVISILNKMELAKELDKKLDKTNYFEAVDARNKRVEDRIKADRKKHNERLKKELGLR